MTIESIQAIQSDKAVSIFESQSATQTEGSSFTQWLDREIGQADSQIAQANDAVKSLALGEADNLHQVMIALDKAQLSFELMVQVRNRVVEGIQEVMRMSI